MGRTGSQLIERRDLVAVNCMTLQASLGGRGHAAPATAGPPSMRSNGSAAFAAGERHHCETAQCARRARTAAQWQVMANRGALGLRPAARHAIALAVGGGGEAGGLAALAASQHAALGQIRPNFSSGARRCEVARGGARKLAAKGARASGCDGVVRRGGATGWCDRQESNLRLSLRRAQ